MLNFSDNATSVAPLDLQLNCSQDFTPFNDSGKMRCVPMCQWWSPYSPITVRVTNILTIVTATFTLLSGSAVVILGCIRRKRM